MRVPDNAKAGDEVKICPNCMGDGESTRVEWRGEDPNQYSVLIHEECYLCHGDGLVKERCGE